MKHVKPQAKNQIEATIDAAGFRKAMAALRRNVEPRNTIPILSYVRVSIGPDGATLCHNNLDTEISITVDADGWGDVALPARALNALLAGGEADKITFRSTDDRVSIGAGALTMDVRPMPVEDYPTHREIDGDLPTIAFPEKAMSWLLDLPSRFVSYEETRYYLNGVFLHHPAAGQLVAVGTDGRRLGLRRLNLVPEAITGEHSGAIIPRAILPTLKQAFGDAEVTARFAKVGKKDFPHAIFTSGRTTIATKLIDGTFPDYNRVIPHEEAPGITCEVDAASLRRFLGVARGMRTAGSLVAAICFASSPSGCVRLSANFDGGVVKVEADAPGSFRGSTHVAFNGGYLRGVLDATKAETLRFAMKDAREPALMSAGDDTIVLMPMRA